MSFVVGQGDVGDDNQESSDFTELSELSEPSEPSDSSNDDNENFYEQKQSKWILSLWEEWKKGEKSFKKKLEKDFVTIAIPKPTANFKDMIKIYLVMKDLSTNKLLDENLFKKFIIIAWESITQVHEKIAAFNCLQENNLLRFADKVFDAEKPRVLANVLIKLQEKNLLEIKESAEIINYFVHYNQDESHQREKLLRSFIKLLENLHKYKALSSLVDNDKFKEESMGNIYFPIYKAMKTLNEGGELNTENLCEVLSGDISKVQKKANKLVRGDTKCGCLRRVFRI